VSVRVGEAPQFWLNASDERFAIFPTMRVRPDADAVHRAADVLARVESASEAIERSGGKVVGTIRLGYRSPREYINAKSQSAACPV